VSSLVRSFPAHPSRLSEIRTFVRKQARQAELSTDASDDLALAVSEASANAILHAGGAMLTVSWEADGERVLVEVRDEGVFRRRVPMPELDGGGGHGIPLMMALMDEVVVREGTEEAPGTLVRLVKYRRRRRERNPA
jgi:anti-sigma regulatory factor (Ser/Thr protein kinase)